MRGLEQAIAQPPSAEAATSPMDNPASGDIVTGRISVQLFTYLLSFGIFGHLFVQLNELMSFGGHLHERRNEVLAVINGACPILCIRHVGIGHVSRNHQFVLLDQRHLHNAANRLQWNVLSITPSRVLARVHVLTPSNVHDLNQER